MDKRLSAEWMTRDDLAALNAALGQGMARFVGGAVRDSLLGLPVKDIDMATLLQPRETMRRLKAPRLRSSTSLQARQTMTC